MIRSLPLTTLLMILGCGPQTGTRLDPLAPRTAVVGLELVVTLHAESDGGQLAISYDSDLTDLKTRHLRPSISTYAGGQAVFRWTPLSADVGDHVVQFNADVDGVATSTRMAVTVVGGAEPLTFREPVGDGTTFDPAKTPCTDVSILIDDTGAAAATLEPGAVWNDNAELMQDTPLSGMLHFCPSADQQLAATLFPFTLVASDETGARAEKRYTIVLGALKVPPKPMPTPTPGAAGPMCDAIGPTITHTPHKDITTSGNLHLYATVADADGVYDATVFYSTTAPADLAKPDLTKMTAIDMLFVGGSSVQSSFAATIANPVYADPPGTTATIYYVLRATDADDAVAGCAYHSSYDPPTGVHSFVVKRSQ